MARAPAPGVLSLEQSDDVSREAQQVIGALTHWPGPAGGEKHSWKDFADLLCYLAMADLQHRDVSEEVCYQ